MSLTPRPSIPHNISKNVEDSNCFPAFCATDDAPSLKKVHFVAQAFVFCWGRIDGEGTIVKHADVEGGVVWREREEEQPAKEE